MDLPRGMRDLGPEDLSMASCIRGKFEESARLFGFKLMDPSPIELLGTMEAKSGPAIRDEVYHFEDKGGRSVALRFDFTVGIARHVCSQQSLKMPAKIGSFGGVWRYDEPQKGRYRHFHQWNAEIFGRPSVESEAEVIDFADGLLDGLGLKEYSIELSHRETVESFISSAYPSFDPVRHAGALAKSLRMIDKAPKKPRQELLAEYPDLPQDYCIALLDFASARGTPSEVEKRAGTGSLAKWDHVCSLWDALESRGVKKKAVNLGVVRGLDYYSGAVFEVLGSGRDALAGGGRYDSMTAAFGRKDIGAVGIAGGVERLALALQEEGAKMADIAKTVAVLYMTPELQGQAVRAASLLRKNKIPAEVDLLDRPFKRQLESAAGSDTAVIFAPSEAEKGVALVKDMKTGEQRQVKADELDKELADKKRYGVY